MSQHAYAKILLLNVLVLQLIANINGLTIIRPNQISNNKNKNNDNEDANENNNNNKNSNNNNDVNIYTDCGVSKMGASLRRILNGRQTVEGDWPWVVSLSTGCSGTLISNSHVLSAAHCAYYNNKMTNRVANITAMFGINRKNGTRIRIASVIVHNKYSSDDYASPDIAIFKLERKVKFNDKIRKICLPLMYNEFYGEIAAVVGFGYDNRTDGERKTEVLQETFIPINEPENCNQYLQNELQSAFFDPKHFICGGGALRGTESGDSGGPLMLNKRGRWFQIGITSFGEMFSDSNIYYDIGAYVRVSEQCSWIAQMTNNEAICVDLDNVRGIGRYSRQIN